MPDWIMELRIKISAPNEADARADAEEIETAVLDEVLANSVDADAELDRIGDFKLTPA